MVHAKFAEKGEREDREQDVCDTWRDFTGDGRPETGEGRQETGDGRRETETGDGRRERRETGDGRDAACYVCTTVNSKQGTVIINQ